MRITYRVDIDRWLPSFPQRMQAVDIPHRHCALICAILIRLLKALLGPASKPYPWQMLMDRNVVDNHVERILRSGGLASKPQLQRLLGILAAHFEGQSTLKPDRVMRELWPDEPKRSSSHLATAMNRLRRALETYYSEAGAEDEVLIRLPRRGGEEAADNHAQIWIAAEPREIPGAPQAAAVMEPTGKVEAANGSAVKSKRNRWWLAAAAILPCCLVAGIMLMRGGHGPPSTARLDGNILVVVNAKGKELWSQSFPEGFWKDFYRDGLAPKMWFGDLDGSGRTSVLMVYHPAVDATSRSSELICFSQDGKEKWRWKPKRVLPELGNEPAIYRTVGTVVLKSKPGTPARIVVMSWHYPQYPTQVALVDANGKTISEYWHSGHLDQMMLADLDGDGRQKILAFGESNGYDEATLVVLDPDHLSGASLETARPELQIHGMGIAHERFRLLLPRSNLNRATNAYNQAGEMTFANGVLRLSVRECNGNEGCVQWYDFDRNLNLRNVYSDDGFPKAHVEYYRGRGERFLKTQEEQAFWKVRCLVGCAGDYVPVVAQQYFSDEAARRGLKTERTASLLPRRNGPWLTGQTRPISSHAGD
ncbi:MAG: helix-turn-helix domain-containing protein [Terracidiphilus sp.]